MTIYGPRVTAAARARARGPPFRAGAGPAFPVALGGPGRRPGGAGPARRAGRGPRPAGARPGPGRCARPRRSGTTAGRRRASTARRRPRPVRDGGPGRLHARRDGRHARADLRDDGLPISGARPARGRGHRERGRRDPAGDAPQRHHRDGPGAVAARRRTRTSTATCCWATPPAELATRYRAGALPDLGLEEFLARYGHRSAAEIDVGVPRWSEDPAPVFAAIANYLRLTDPAQAPDRRFAAASREAEAKIDELVRRARRTRPVRAVGCRVLPPPVPRPRRAARTAQVRVAPRLRRDAPPAPRGGGGAPRARAAGPGRRHRVPRPPGGPRRRRRRRPAGAGRRPAATSTRGRPHGAASPGSCSPTAPCPKRSPRSARPRTGASSGPPPHRESRPAGRASCSTRPMPTSSRGRFSSPRPRTPAGRPCS